MPLQNTNPQQKDRSQKITWGQPAENLQTLPLPVYAKVIYVWFALSLALIILFLMLASASGAGGIGAGLIAWAAVPQTICLLIASLLISVNQIMKSRKLKYQQGIINIIMAVSCGLILVVPVSYILISRMINQHNAATCAQKAASGQYHLDLSKHLLHDTECGVLIHN